ncbi:hypothetical protein O181_007364 [Austropuccinia psidii MF-1]|uniref:Integrase catalytic domain-containing protein n=1 Tax=Austropuccinia psidii MF-1 TaxID=1389203 RepID=A0A9Q3GHT5_9BASI|nr:hypothetical protein [Austropuccinia psidii MF-1]
MLGTKLSFSTSYHPQTDEIAKMMLKTMEYIVKIFCTHGMRYKDHKWYTHDLVKLLLAIHLAYNTSQHSNTGKSTSLVEGRWNPLLPVDHLKKNLLIIYPTIKYFHDMWKRAFEKGER